MSRQANLTLTALAQQGCSMPDVPIRHMKLNHRAREVILGRASLKEPRPNRDGSKSTKEVSRIARDDNGYMSRNETIASEHAALLLTQDGEVCLEHRAGSFPPTFLNGNRVNEIVTVQNNDIINLGPLTPYYSRSKERLYQPFALKMNLTFEHVLLSDDDNSSSSSDDEVTSLHEVPSHHEHPDRLEMIRGHEIIEVSDEESGESDEEDALYTRTSQTVIIDLTESEVEQRADAVNEQAEVSPHVAFAEYDDSSSAEGLDEEIDENEIADLEDDMESIDNDSIFGDNYSNAPSEHPIERKTAALSFPPNFHLNYKSDPGLFRDELDFDMNVIEDASEEDEDDVDYEPDIGPHQNSFVSKELSDFQEAEEQRTREKERILEKARKIHELMTEEQQKQEAKLRAALFEAKKIKDMIMQQQQKQRPAELSESFEAEQRVAWETNQKMADRKAHEVEEIELARQQDLIKDLNKKRFGDLVADADTPPQESIHSQNTTGFHQQGRSTHQTYMPPLAEPNTAVNEDVHPDEAFRFNVLDDHDLNPVSNPCQSLVNPAAELPSYHSPYEPPRHSFDEFAAAREENTLKMAREMVHGQHPPAPTLLMSSSLFGQPIEAGMTLPPPNPKQKEDPYARFRVTTLADSKEAAQKYFADQRSPWRARQNGKVSINDLVEHEEKEEDSSEGESLERAVETELAKGMRDDSPAEVQKKQKDDLRYLMFKHLEYPIPVPNTAEFALWKENQKETSTDPSSSSPVDNPPNLSDKVGDDESEPSAPSTPSKKRKHVEFEEHDTIISPVSGEAQESYTSMATDFDGVTINSAHFNNREIVMAGINSELDADTNASAAFAVSAAGNPAEKHVHFLSLPVTGEQGEHPRKMEEQVIERPIARPHRPSKRVKMMKNVAEKAAYVLAGAAVASVGVFAALVSTAPEDF